MKTLVRKIIEDVGGKNHPDILNSFYTSEWFIILFVSVLELPLTLAKKIEKLKFFAFFGVGGIIIFMVCLVIQYSITPSEGDEISGMRAFPDDWFGAAAAVPNLILAASFQMNFFPIYKGMKNSSDSKMNLAAFLGVGACIVSYLLVGIIGYSLIGEDVEANFLQSLVYDQTEKPLYFMMNIGFLMSVFFSFSVIFFGARNNFIALVNLITSPKRPTDTRWRWGPDDEPDVSSYIQIEDGISRKKRASVLFLVYTFILYALLITAGILLEDIEAVFNVVGAVCSSSISIILPCLFYVELVRLKRKDRKPKFYIAFIIVLVFTPYAIFSIVAKYIAKYIE